jgi:hypothetical protein
MFSANPQVAESGYRILLKGRRGIGAFFIWNRQERVDLTRGESCQIQIEIRLAQFLQLEAQRLFIPASVFSQPVVRKNVCAFLCFRQMVQNNDRDLFQLQFTRRQKAPVAGLRNPNSAMLAAIWATWASEWVRGFLA